MLLDIAKRARFAERHLQAAYLPQPEGLFKLMAESFNKLLGY